LKMLFVLALIAYGSIENDPVKPGGKLGLAVEILQVVKGLNKGILGCFFRFWPVIENLERNRKGIGLVLVYHYGIALPFPCQYPVDKDVFLL
jgi:hypothetical protein